MRFVYFALGWMLGVLVASGASRIDGPAPVYVLVVAGAGLVFVVIVIFTWWSDS